MFSDFPNLHPLVVHFPVVLLVLSAVLQAVLVFKDWQQVRWITLFMLAGGFLGALAASTIFHAMPAGLSPQATRIFNEHEKYADFTLWMSGITFLLRGIGEFYQLNRRSFEILVFISALLTAVFISITGHRGAQLVYVEGVGPQGNLLMKGDHHHGGETPGMKGKPMEEHGSGGHNEGMPMDSVSRQGAMKDMPGMDGKGQPRMDDMKNDNGSGTTHNMPGMDEMPEMNHQQMPGMNKAPHNKSNSSQMDHQMPGMNTNSSNKKQNNGQMENMAGMDHSQPQPTTMPGMNHENMTTPKNGTQPSEMPGMGPGTNTNQMNGMNHGNGAGNTRSRDMENKTDLNGRPLIDATKPYDNNPAWEQKNSPRKP